MGIENWFSGKISAMTNKKGKPDLTSEQERLATKAVQRASGENIINETARAINETMPRAEQSIQKLMREGLNKQEPFGILYQGFSADVASIRKMVAKYNDTNDSRLAELQGDEILVEADIIKNKIEDQIKISNSSQEKGDFANLTIELENIIKNVSGVVEKKRVNE